MRTETLIKKTPSKELIAAAKSELSARAYVKLIRPIIEEIQKKNLTALNVKSEWSGQLISEIKLAYQMPEDLMQIYIDMNHASYIDAGFVVKREYCPLLIAEELERCALRRMVALSEEIAPAGFDTEELYGHIDILKEYEELTLSYVAQFINKFSHN